jgi:hypothetical protein
MKRNSGGLDQIADLRNVVKQAVLGHKPTQELLRTDPYRNWNVQVFLNIRKGALETIEIGKVRSLIKY